MTKTEGGNHEGVTVVSLVIERGGAVLLGHRGRLKDHAPGEWEAISGRVEPGETLIEAARREALEETGLLVEVVRHLDYFRFRRGADAEVTVGATFHCRVRDGTERLSPEHDRFVWADLVQARDIGLPAGLVRCIEAVLEPLQTTIGRAGPADIPALVELMSQFYIESGYALDREWAAASFAQLLRDESRGAVWIARRGAEPAGHVVLALKHSMEFGGLAGVIDDLFVRPPFRRQGVGSALLSALFDACREFHLAAVHVEVDPGNVAALGLYRARGLREQSGRQTLTVQLGVQAG